MKILITGAKGQLGRELTLCFERGYTELGTPEVLKENNSVVAVDLDELDIANLSDVLAFFEKEKPDAVINCAAFTNVNLCETEKDLAFRANAQGPRNLAIAAKKIGAKLIHVSTDYVFDGEGSVPYVEWDIPSPKSVYGASKYLGEEYIKQFTDKYFIVRTSWLYGYYGNNFVKTIVKIASEKHACRVVSDQRGNPTNAADLAHHLIKLLPTEEYGIYHGTGNGECSWFDFAKEIVSLAGIDADVSPCTTEEYPTPAKRPSYSSLDNMMFRASVGDEFRHWQEALKSFFTNPLK